MPTACDSPEKRAEAIKAEGNKLYRNYDFQGAIKSYEQAYSVVPLPVYLSNLSAAQFELGKYSDVVTTIAKALPVLDKQSDSVLWAKLSLRSARANALLMQLEESLSDLAMVLQAHISEDITSSASSLQKLVLGVKGSRDAFHREEKLWRQGLLALPRYRPSPISLLEFYTCGHDDPCSIMAAPAGFSPNLKFAKRMRMKIPDDGRHFEFSALFGGIGDARNFFGTLWDIGSQLETDSRRAAAAKFHFTLLDIHPAAVARDLVIFSFLEDLVTLQSQDSGFTSPRARLILNTLHFLYWSPVMPPSLYDALIEKIRVLSVELFSALASDGFSNRLFHMDLPTAKTVAACMAWWLGEGQNVRKAEDTLFQTEQVSMADFSGGNPLVQRMEDLANARKTFDAMKMFEDPATVSALRRQAAAIGMPYELYVHSLKQRVLNGDNPMRYADTPKGCEFERRIYETLKIFLPSKDVDEPANFHKAVEVLERCMVDRAKQRLAADGTRTLDRRIASWRVNVTYLADGWIDPDRGHNPFVLIRDWARLPYLKPHLPKSPTRLADYSCAFFAHTAQCLGRLLSFPQSSCVVELVVADVWEFIEGVTMQTADRGVLPSEYDRIHLSNVPDYTGGHATMAAIAVPLLKTHPQSYVTFNCLLNSGLFGNGVLSPDGGIDAHIYQYLATTRSGLSSAFGIELLLTVPFALADYAMLARSSIAPPPMSRTEANDLLCGLFMRCVLPAPWDNPTVRMTPREVVNVHTLLRLLRILGHRYPVHQLSDFVASIMENKLTTTVELHQHSPIPLPRRSRTTDHGVCCSPFQAEFEVAAALWAPLQPFALLCAVPSIEDIAVFSISVGGLAPFIRGYIDSDIMSLMFVIGTRQELLKFGAHVRHKIWEDAKMKTSLNLISTFHWEPESLIAHVPLTCQTVESFIKRELYCAVADTRFWCLTSTIEPCRRLQKTGNLYHQHPTVSLGRPVGGVSEAAEQHLFSLITNEG